MFMYLFASGALHFAAIPFCKSLFWEIVAVFESKTKQYSSTRDTHTQIHIKFQNNNNIKWEYLRRLHILKHKLPV